MANIEQTAKVILDRCRRETTDYFGNSKEEGMNIPFKEHLWSTTVTDRAVHEFYIASIRAGEVGLIRSVNVDNTGEGSWGLLATFSFRNLATETMAKAVEAIIENY